MRCLEQNPPAARVLISIAEFRAWISRAKPGERFEYHRGLLAIDRVKSASALKEAERRKLAAVAEHALALAGGGKMHLMQERHGNDDYSYWAVARAPAGSSRRVLSRFPVGHLSERRRP